MQKPRSESPQTWRCASSSSESHATDGRAAPDLESTAPSLRVTGWLHTGDLLHPFLRPHTQRRSKCYYIWKVREWVQLDASVPMHIKSELGSVPRTVSDCDESFLRPRRGNQRNTRRNREDDHPPVSNKRSSGVVKNLPPLFLVLRCPTL